MTNKMKKANKGILLVFLSLLFVLFFSWSVFATHTPKNYTFIIGKEPVEGPDISMARNGDTITLTGEGTFGTFPKMATGGGTFVHKNADGDVLGTGKWAATKLISFQPYGNASAQGFPDNLEGGRVLLKVILDPDSVGPSFDGTLRITCLLGNKIPLKAKEGVRLDVRQIPINFNEEVSGETVFIRIA
ncbi:hypothetical protein HYW75_01755 [Candidatus Pacearchaeota archaeon]|nr:hypothetical protein [Candidatus Pacearchaeota archaeon]